MWKADPKEVAGFVRRHFGSLKSVRVFRISGGVQIRATSGGKNTAVAVEVEDPRYWKLYVASALKGLRKPGCCG